MKEQDKQKVIEWFQGLEITDMVSLWNLVKKANGYDDEVFHPNNDAEWWSMYKDIPTFEFAVLCGGNTINTSHDYFVDTIYGPKTVESFEAKHTILDNVTSILYGVETMEDFVQLCEEADVDCSDLI